MKLDITRVWPPVTSCSFTHQLTCVRYQGPTGSAPHTPSSLSNGDAPASNQPKGVIVYSNTPIPSQVRVLLTLRIWAVTHTHFLSLTHTLLYDGLLAFSFCLLSYSITTPLSLTLSLSLSLLSTGSFILLGAGGVPTGRQLNRCCSCCHGLLPLPS